MNTEIAAAKTRTKEQAGTNEHENIQAGIDSVSKGSLYAMGIVSGVIGLWAALYFLTAMMSDGPVNLLKNWISAITGI